MRHARPWSGRLPTVYLDGHVHVVEFEKQEFRRLTEDIPDVRTVDFESTEGREMWAQLMILECPRCGATVVSPRYGCGARCDVRRKELLV
jgi:hypothetical protein